MLSEGLRPVPGCNRDLTGILHEDGCKQGSYTGKDANRDLTRGRLSQGSYTNKFQKGILHREGCRQLFYTAYDEKGIYPGKDAYRDLNRGRMYKGSYTRKDANRDLTREGCKQDLTREGCKQGYYTGNIHTWIFAGKDAPGNLQEEG